MQAFVPGKFAAPEGPGPLHDGSVITACLGRFRLLKIKAEADL